MEFGVSIALCPITVRRITAYRFCDYANNRWSAPITLTTDTTFGPVYFPAGAFPFNDPDPSVAKELDVLMNVTQ